MTVESYTLTETLRHDGELTLHRGFDADGSPVLILAPVRTQPALGRLENEYALRAELDPDWAVRPLALTEHDGRRVLVREDPGGALLADLLASGSLGKPMALAGFLPIAIELSLAIGRMHGRGLIHKDLKPDNIFVAGNAAADDVRVRLTDFGIASRQPRERQRPEPPEIIAGTLAYMAPEQTGRMNRSLDSRADLYSLGIVYYEMLTGALPFDAADAMEWVHCHVARQATAPDQRRPDLPRPLSDLVIKLLAKTAEDRYQSAAGVTADLRHCRSEWTAHQRIDPFPLGTHDAPDRLRIPEKLVGREHAVASLLAAFERVRADGRPEFVFVRGHSGIGKSSVVNEINKSLITPRGLFAAGKFDQVQRDVPYATLGQALQGLVRALLVQSDAVLEAWRQALQTALAAQAGLLFSLVPELELVIGPQAAVPELAPREAENRFLAVLARCLGVFAQEEHPLVLFLDDLQWLDAATLKFLEYLAGLAAPTALGRPHERLTGASLPLQGGGQEGDGVRNGEPRSSAPIPHPHPGPPLEGEGARAHAIALDSTLGDPGRPHERLGSASLPLQGGGQEGDGVIDGEPRSSAPIPHPLPGPPLEGEGEVAGTNPDLHHLLLIGAYRDNEVDAAHPLGATLDAIRKTPVPISEIVLTPLSAAEIDCLVADALRCAPDCAAALARLTHEKTGGNPFFAIQFLMALADERLLTFDAAAMVWRCDLPRIHAKADTENVVDLMLAKLARLPTTSRDALKRLACLGNKADATILALVHGRPAAATDADIGPAIQAGLVLRSQDQEVVYEFIHDRVREGAYALIPVAARAAEHLRVGRLLVSCLPPEAIAARIFEVTGQLNRGIDLITGADERLALYRLNVEAGRRAKTAIGYAAAADHLAQALALLPATAWETDYAATFALHLDGAECEHLAGHPAAADALFERALANARTPLDRARVCRLHSRLYQTSGNFDKAMSLLVDALHELGVTLPAAEASLLAAAEQEIGEIKANLADRPIAALAAAPPATDATGELIIALLVEALGPAYAAKPPYFPLFATKAVSATLRYGSTPESSVAYVAYAIVLIAGAREIKSAFAYSQMALALLDRFENPRPRGLALVAHAGMVLPWCTPLADSLPLVEQGLDTLLDSGDFLNAAYSIMFPVLATLEAGRPLDEVLGVADRVAALAGKVHNDLACDTVRLCRRWLVRLKGSSGDADRLDGLSEAECLARFTRTGWEIGLAYHHVMRLATAFIDGDYAEAMAAAAASYAVLRYRTAMPVAATQCFYRALTLAALYRRAPADKQAGYARALGDDLRKFKLWASQGPENFESRYALVAAEVARNEGRELDAEYLYEQAIRSAHAHGFVHNEALAGELAADFHRDRGFATTAFAYLRNARDAYLQWGAAGKVAALDARHAGLELPQMPAAAATATIGVAVEQLDAISVVKASQAVSGEIIPDQLIRTLMRITVEHAAAERGLLLLVDGKDYRIAAEATIGERGVDVSLRHDSPLLPHEAPMTLLRYVLRTRQRVLIDNALAPHPFGQDVYWRERDLQSVLCLPLVKATTLVGMLYLENTLAGNAFSRQRVAVLELLASQAAITLENAALYAGLREENANRQRAEARLKRLVESNIIGVFFWNVRGGVSSANDAFLRIVGYSRDDLDAGRLRWLDITAPEYLPAVEHAVEQLKQSGICTPYEKEVIRQDGVRVPVLVGLALFEGSREEGVGFVLDLSERQARVAAEAANRAKGQFLASMSHELRSPLNTILGFSRLMAREPGLPAPTREDLERILKSGEHLYALINNVLDLSKIESGRVTLNEADFDLDLMLDELREAFAVTAADKGIELAFVARVTHGPRSRVPRQLRGDPLKLRQVLTNLLGNAIKFTESGSIIVRVDRVDQVDQGGSGDTGDWVRLAFTIADTGVGIAADELPTLFDAFAQAQGGREAREGTGLGLAISRGLVHLMGGDIHLDSALGRGTTARFEIVVRALAGPASADVPILPAARRAVGLDLRQPRYRLLVVDDLADARQLVVRLLAPLGFELKEAAGGEQAVELARQWQPHLIWMDMRMPGIDGGEATRRIRALGQTPPPAIIALTASAFDDERARALREGCDDLLHKPLRESDLLTALEEHLGVRFVYEDLAASPSTPRVPENALNRLPEALRVQLAVALRGLDMAAIDQAIAVIREHDRVLAASLAAWAADFQYEHILTLIRGTERPPDTEPPHEPE